MVVSYTSGASLVPLFGQALGENLSDTARRSPDADALVVVEQGVRLTYAEFANPFERRVVRCQPTAQPPRRGAVGTEDRAGDER